MLICCDCGRAFECPATSVEKHGLDTPPYEVFTVCPHCKSPDIHEAHRCDVCGDWICGDYIESADGLRICDACYIRRRTDED